MNRLRKKAITEMIIVVICCVTMLLSFGVMTAINTQGVGNIFIMLFVGPIVGVVAYAKLKKQEDKLDEREQGIRDTAAKYSYMVYVGYTLVFCMASFFLVGGRGSIAVWTLPAMFAVGLLIGQTVQSVYILGRCPEEQEDE
jgi:4-hydroxybenzoate polyprenyltransferase